MKETLYIFSNDYEISKSYDSINCVTQDALGKKEKHLVPTCRLDSIEIYGNITITNPVFAMCNKEKIPIYFNTYNGNPLGKYIPYDDSTQLIRINQIKAYLDKNKKLHIAKAIVRKAINERIRIIEKYDKRSGQCATDIEKIGIYEEKIDNCTSVSELRGIEGNYMKHYFRAFRKLLKHLSFKKRTTRPPKDSGNAILSWGNVLLYNTVNSEVYKTGLDTKIGFLHEPQENRDSLSIDISEIFRPIIVDNLILQLDRKHHLSEKKHFRRTELKCLLNNIGKTVWIKNYKNFLHQSLKFLPLQRKISLKEEIKIEAYNLVKYLNGEKKQYIPVNFRNR